jgi:hypothetical protein
MVLLLQADASFRFACRYAVIAAAVTGGMWQRVAVVLSGASSGVHATHMKVGYVFQRQVCFAVLACVILALLLRVVEQF